MKRILALLIIIFITSCERDVIINIPPQPLKLVVNGVVRTTTAFRVTVGKTAGVLDTTSSAGLRINNAFVQLYENNILVDTLIHDAPSNTYLVKRNTRALPGKTYLLKAVAQGFPSVEAETTTPNVIAIQSITRRMNVKKNASGDFLDEVKITFNDEVAENHYLVRVRRPRLQTQNTVGYTGINCMRSTDTDIEGRNDGDPTEFETCIDDEFFLRDKNFNGKTKEIVLFILHDDLEPLLMQNPNRHVKPIVELHSITADQFKYRKTLGAYRDAEDNPFAEPVLLYGNIKNGYGIFVTYDLARDTIR